MSDEVCVGLAQVFSRESGGRLRAAMLDGTCETTVADRAIPCRYGAQLRDLYRCLDLAAVAGRPVSHRRKGLVLWTAAWMTCILPKYRAAKVDAPAIMVFGMCNNLQRIQ